MCFLERIHHDLEKVVHQLTLLAGARFATFLNFVLIWSWRHQWVELSDLATHHAHEIWRRENWHGCWIIGRVIEVAMWSSWTRILFLDLTGALWSTGNFFIVNIRFFRRFLFNCTGTRCSRIFVIDNLLLFDFCSFKLISRLLLVHLNDVIGYIIDIIRSISILLLKRSNRVHEMLISTHWSDIWALVHLILLNHTFHRCFVIIFRCLVSSNVERADTIGFILLGL